MRYSALLLALCVICLSCRQGEAPTTTSSSDRAAGEPDAQPAQLSEENRGPLVVFLGDSLSAGFGLSQEEAFPARLGELLAEKQRQVRITNAGVSGDTTAGGLSRLPWVLKQNPDVVVVELGGNDGLRGLPVEHTEDNLRKIVELARQAGSRVLLVGIQVPPNYGPDYAHSFAEIFPRLAEEMSVPLVPFLLEGVAAHPELNLPDGIHPTAEGHRRVAAHVLPYLESVLDDLSTPHGAAPAPPGPTSPLAQ